MRRREFLAVVAGAVASPFAALAQQSNMPVMGWLNTQSPATYSDYVRAFQSSLAEGGFVEGRNFAIEWRWAEDRFDRLPALAAELVRRKVTVIVAGGGEPAVRAAREATTSIPIVAPFASDPVHAGLVASIRRPNGNVTGVTLLGGPLFGKNLELLRELVPSLAAVAMLVNPHLMTPSHTETYEAAARALGLRLDIVGASTDEELDSAFARIVALGSGALMVQGDPGFLFSRRDRVHDFAARRRLPAAYATRRNMAPDGLMSYSTDFIDGYRRLSALTARILKGENPADIPVDEATRIELIVNLKAAKALGIALPLSILNRADAVIE